MLTKLMSREMRMEYLEKDLEDIDRFNKMLDKIIDKIKLNEKEKEELIGIVHLISEREQMISYYCPHDTITVKEGIDHRCHEEYFLTCDHCGLQMGASLMNSFSVYNLIMDCEKVGIKISKFLNEDRTPVNFDEYVKLEKIDLNDPEKKEQIETIKKFFKKLNSN